MTHHGLTMPIFMLYVMWILKRLNGYSTDIQKPWYITQRDRLYRTKPELALEMKDEDIKLGVKFDWIGGDALYGHNQQLTKDLDELGLFYVLDVHKDELIYTEEPII